MTDEEVKKALRLCSTLGGSENCLECPIGNRPSCKVDLNLSAIKSIERLEATLFVVVRNSIVLPVGMRMRKSQEEITKMTFNTIKELQTQI